MATLTGSATLERYESPGATRVVVFPQDRTTWLEADRYAHRFQSAFLSRDLSFRVPPLPPGEYYVALVPNFAFFEFSGRTLEPWARTAARVTLRPGETTKVALKR